MKRVGAGIALLVDALGAVWCSVMLALLVAATVGIWRAHGPLLAGLWGVGCVLWLHLLGQMEDDPDRSEQDADYDPLAGERPRTSSRDLWQFYGDQLRRMLGMQGRSGREL